LAFALSMNGAIRVSAYSNTAAASTLIIRGRIRDRYYL
jgi:hypothetical protein